MTDRIKESLFNILVSHFGQPPLLPDLQVVDLFAGTGSLGLEALSRGAATCLFVETDPAALCVLRQNIGLLGVEERCAVRQADVFAFVATAADLQASFDLAFVDPPYRTSRDVAGGSLMGGLLQGISVLLRRGGLAVLRHERTVQPQANYGPLHCTKRRDHTSEALTFFEVTT